MHLVANVLQVVAILLGAVFAVRSVRGRSDVTLETAHRDVPWLRPVMLGCFVACLASLAPVLSDRVCQRLPLAMQGAASLVFWSALLASFGFLSGVSWAVAVRTRHEQGRALLFAAVLLNVALGVVYARSNAPIAGELEERTTTDGVILQTSGGSCAAASVANVLGRFGTIVTERQIAQHLGTTRFGTSPGEMRRTLAAFGVSVSTLDGDARDLLEVRPPAILFVDHPSVGSEGHAVAYFGPDGDGFEIWDPLVGKRRWASARVWEVWHGAGIECRAGD